MPEPRATATTPSGWSPVPPADGEGMPPHMPDCMGCGPDAISGYHLKVRRKGNEVVATFSFDSTHAGGPGLAHGGAVAAVMDDLLGHVMTLHGVPAVTRRLEVDYLAPVLLHEPHHLSARLDQRDGRKLWITGEGRAPDGREVFGARGLFVQVGLEHFLAGLSPEERARSELVYSERGVIAP